MKWIKNVFRGWKRPVWILGILATMLILVWVVIDIATGIKLRRAIAAWQEARFPMDVREIVSPKAPSEENAAVILNHVIPMREPRFVAINDVKVWTRPFELEDRRVERMEKRATEIGDELFTRLGTSDISTDLVDELKTILSEPTLVYKRQMGKQAVTYPLFYAYHDYELWPELLLAHVGPLRSLGKLLQAEAVVYAIEGQWVEAYEGVIVSFLLGQLLSDEPLIISQLTLQSLNYLSLKKLETFLRTQSPPAESLRRLREILGQSEQADMVRSILVEVTMTTEYLYRKLDQGEFAPSEFASSSVDFSWLDKGVFRPLHKADFATFMNRNRERMTLLGRSSDKMDHYRLMDEWEDSVTFPWYAPVARNLFFLSSRVHLSGVEASARLALAQLALAAHEYRAATGEWPSSLKDLVPVYLPEIPRDPFGTSSMRYDRNEAGVILYSVGPNGNDDGGRSVEKVHRDEPGDIVWVLEENGSK